MFSLRIQERFNMTRSKTTVPQPTLTQRSSSKEMNEDETDLLTCKYQNFQNIRCQLVYVVHVVDRGSSLSTLEDK